MRYRSIPNKVNGNIVGVPSICDMPSVVRIFSDEESAIQISIDLAATLSGSPGPVGLVDHPPGAHAQSIGRIVYQWRDCMFLLDRRPF